MGYQKSDPEIRTTGDERPRFLLTYRAPPRRAVRANTRRAHDHLDRAQQLIGHCPSRKQYAIMRSGGFEGSVRGAGLGRACVGR